ncbi:MarR family transcriptional regulator [Myxococcota bacterium]|nr:MarR family transcriptional regulator [Myxococcota bacterium]
MASRREEVIRRILEIEESVHRTLGWTGEAAWNGLELGHGQLKILLLVRAQGPVTVGEIARALLLSKATVSETLDRMVAGGWVNRSVDPKDRRRVRVSLSDKGAEVAGNLVSAGHRRTERLLSRMDDLELDQVRLGLEAMERAARRLTLEVPEEGGPAGDGRDGP